MIVVIIMSVYLSALDTELEVFIQGKYMFLLTPRFDHYQYILRLGVHLILHYTTNRQLLESLNMQTHKQNMFLTKGM